MRLRHTSPCSECPWRKRAAAGWLGGFTPAFYADAALANEVPACHLQDFGPDDPRSSMCAGAVACMTNGAVSAWKTPGGDDARKVVGRRDDVFANPRDFYQHHADEPWTHPLLRETSVHG